MLYTPEASIARQSFAQDLALLPAEQRLSVPVVSSAAPMAAHRLSFADEKIRRSVADTLAAVFVTPAMQCPRCTTLIVGAWGTVDPAVEPELVAATLAEWLAVEGAHRRHVRRL